MEPDRYIRITLRIPKDLHARLDVEADRTSRSLNAEIIGRLELSFPGSPLQIHEIRNWIAALETRISTLRGMLSNEALRHTILLETIRRMKTGGAEPSELKPLHEEVALIAKTEAELQEDYRLYSNELEQLRLQELAMRNAD